MKKEEVLGILQDNGFVLDEEKAIAYGIQFLFRNGAKISVFDKGTVTPQGQHIDQVKVLLGLAAPTGNSSATATTIAVRRKVFVVYGHDPDSRSQLEAMLRRWDLDPLILDQLPSEGQTISKSLKNTRVKLISPLFWPRQMILDFALATRMKRRIVLARMLSWSLE